MEYIRDPYAVEEARLQTERLNKTLDALDEKSDAWKATLTDCTTYINATDVRLGTESSRGSWSQKDVKTSLRLTAEQLATCNTIRQEWTGCFALPPAVVLSRDTDNTADSEYLELVMNAQGTWVRDMARDHITELMRVKGVLEGMVKKSFGRKLLDGVDKIIDRTL